MPTDTPFGLDSNFTTSWNGQCIGGLVFLLPFIEQDNLSRLILAGAPGDYLSPNVRRPSWDTIPSFWNNRGAQIKTFLCPSDDANLANADLLIYGYQTSAAGGFTLSGWTWGAGSNIGKTNYLPIAGRLGIQMDPFRGAMTNRSNTKVATIGDGSSNTFLYGEYATKTLGGTRYNVTWLESHAFPLAWGAVPPNPVDANWFMLSSRHTGVMLFTLADGSVRNVRYPGNTAGPQLDTYIFFAGASDGRTFNPDNL